MYLWLVASQMKTGEKRWFRVGNNALLFGRSAGSEEPGKQSLDMDAALSRRHFTAVVEDGRLHVRRAENKHPLFFNGQAVEDFMLAPGQHFTSAQTLFRVASQEPTPEQPTTFFTLSAQNLSDAKEQNAHRCLQALLRLRPLLFSGQEPVPLFTELLPLLSEMVPGAGTVMALQAHPDGSYDTLAVHGGSDADPPAPSRTLLRRAVEAGEPSVFLWTDSGVAREGGAGGPTAYAGVRWALAAPIRGDANYALYAVGSESMQKLGSKEGPGQLDQAVMALVADMIGDALQTRRLYRVEGQLGQFFSPALRKLIIKDPDTTLLKLDMREVTALFLDLRGFSRATEEAQKDEARWQKFVDHFETLVRIMTGVTERIFETDGIVVDFQGDAVFGCWGAPIAQEDHRQRAVAAAEAIMQWLSENRVHPLQEAANHLPCGIGISSGRILVGNVGMAGQINYQTIGRCVNEASRLEGLTKYFRVPVLLTGATRNFLPENVLCRRVARVRPAGMDVPLDLYERVLPASYGGSGLTADDVAAYDKALEAFEVGRMEEAEQLLHALPLTDPVRRFLNHQVERYLLEGIPHGWDGIIEFQQK